MKTPEQLKGAIRNIAKENDLQANEVLHLFLFERLLERLSISSYKNNLILKGGLLISSLIGVAGRTTMDMDLTAEEISMEEENIKAVFKSIFAIDTGDGIKFDFERLTTIRTKDQHKNFRIYFTASYGKIQTKMKIDTTSGDVITPGPMEYSFITLFKEKSIPIMAYTLETIIAEKYLSIIKLGTANTRARDFYDLYKIFHLYKERIKKSHLKLAIKRTAIKRNVLDVFKESKNIITEISNDPTIKNLWQNYANEYSYASNIKFKDVIKSLTAIDNLIKES